MRKFQNKILKKKMYSKIVNSIKYEQVPKLSELSPKNVIT